MARIKKGTSTGKDDMNYTTIHIGDVVKNKNNQMIFTVNSYGSLENDYKTEKGWDGSDYIVVKKWDEALREKAEAKTEEAIDVIMEEIPSDPPAEPLKSDEAGAPAVIPQVPLKRDYEAEIEALKKEVEEWKTLAHEAMDETDKATRDHWDEIGRCSDQELAAILRGRGYELAATKTIIVTL